VCIKPLDGRRSFFFGFITHFRDDDIPHDSHRLIEVHRAKALQYCFMETPRWHAYAHAHAYIDFMHAHHARIHESQ
jgi:hypothetical protein